MWTNEAVSAKAGKRGFRVPDSGDRLHHSRRLLHVLSESRLLVLSIDLADLALEIRARTHRKDCCWRRPVPRPRPHGKACAAVAALLSNSSWAARVFCSSLTFSWARASGAAIALLLAIAVTRRRGCPRTCPDAPERSPPNPRERRERWGGGLAGRFAARRLLLACASVRAANAGVLLPSPVWGGAGGGVCLHRRHPSPPVFPNFPHDSASLLVPRAARFSLLSPARIPR